MANKKYFGKFAITPKLFIWILGIMLVISFGLYIISYSNLFIPKVSYNRTEIKPVEQSISSQSGMLRNNLDKPKFKSSPTPLPKPVVNYSPTSSTGIPILTYHYITDNPNPKDIARNNLEVPPSKFDEQMQYLSSNGYTPISLDTLYAIFINKAGKPAKPVVLTFDDGYIDFYTNAFPILRKFNFHAVSFIPTGLIGTAYYMNWSQIREIQSSGLVTFEDHTVTHANLTSMSYAAALKQMVDSKNTLASQTGYPVNFIAYPYGINNSDVQLASQKAGFLGGFGTWFGKANGMGMNMPRIKVSGYWSVSEFASRL